jgi:transcriptional regulator GlxA family with amidase domain
MMIDNALSGEKPQPGQQSVRKAADPLVKKAILRMQQNMEVPKSVADLARDLDIGSRSLERRFLKDLKVTPFKVYLELRLDRALVLLRTTDDTVTRIAFATGFCDAPHLTRTLRAERGFSASEYRKGQIGHSATLLRGSPLV